MWKKLIQHFTRNMSLRRTVAIVFGTIVAGIGIAILKFSLCGNDSYSAMNMSLSDGFHIGLGTFQLLLNIGIIIVQLLFGRKYIGFGTIMNMCFLGYIVQFASFVLQNIFGSLEGGTLPLRLLVMLLALIVLAFGLAMYQVADLGVAPYDYLSLGLANKTKRPYFIFRVITDVGCIAVVLIAFFAGLFPWSGSNIGIGTVACAFGLGPLINIFMRFHKKWIR